MDYCNVLLYGLPKKTLHISQRDTNYAVRLILRFSKSEHITPVLYYLHWLPVELRVDYKMLLYTYKALHDHAPPYICDQGIRCPIFFVCFSNVMEWFMWWPFDGGGLCCVFSSRLKIHLSKSFTFLKPHSLALSSLSFYISLHYVVCI